MLFIVCDAVWDFVYTYRFKRFIVDLTFSQFNNPEPAACLLIIKVRGAPILTLFSALCEGMI